MRLTSRDVEAIKAATVEAFGTDTVVRLFGSRVVDHRRGGDIDLHFEVSVLPGLNDRSRFLDEVEAAMDGQKVDTVFSVRGTVRSGFERIAYRVGIVL